MPVRSRLHLTAPLAAAQPGDDPLDLREIDLREGLFAGADLSDAELGHARLTMADLSGANLRGARLGGADLALVDLRGADLSGADLSGADLSGADLRDACVTGADFDDTELAFANVRGARGLPEAVAVRPTKQGIVQGTTTAAGEPVAAMRAFERGRLAHAQGRLGEAERHYRQALAWVPESDAARYAMGCVALERKDPAAARRWWQAALDQHDGADRARLELAVLALWRSDLTEARRLLNGGDGAGEDGPPARTAAACEAALACLAGQLPDAQARSQAVSALQEVLGDCPSVRWFNAEATSEPRHRQPDTAARVADEAWVLDERTDLAALTRGDEQPAWVWHGAVARAISIGAMDLAALAEQRLTRVAPEHRLWSLELRQLDRTGEAFEALVRTRHRALGAIRSVRWMAIGAHGPTARIDCESGVFFGKRYLAVSRPAASVAFTHRLTQAMADHGVRVPLPIPDAAGQTTMAFADDLLALYPDMGGRSVADDDIDTEQAALLGSQLAAIHNAGQEVAGGPGRPRRGVRAGSRIVRHRSPDAAFEAWLATHRATAAAFEHHAQKRRIMSLLRAVGRRLQSVVHRCAITICHGDFGPGNVLLTPDGPPAVIDWDLADCDLAAWDLARTIDRVAVRWPDVPGEPTEIRLPIAAAIMAGYESRRTLHALERSAVPILVAASRVDLDATVLGICTPVQEDIAEPLLDRVATRLARAAAGMPELLDAMVSVST